ncbi:TetR/AcrR family transcriptional regulator [Amycolatopsis aidingensis]|uniref:TetR/AcrR family transcriptional regulator n=1 Tax=Amycolatopsis aidingensis TaxID=2842453 RepID=UPI001E395399|nr:TetR/AcrR family transcriptional regulator [Amycolatopsis aidingensis]
MGSERSGGPVEQAAMDAEQLPAQVRLWLPAEHGSRGPAPGYSRDQIADAAIALADEQGLAAVSMRKVAARLGTGAMSLYRYVENKEALYDLMLDRMMGTEPRPELTGDWRLNLRVLAREHRRMYLIHPWLTLIAGGRPAMGPNMLRGLEYAMAAVDGLGLGIDDMLETFEWLNSWVAGFAQREIAEREAWKHTDPEQWQECMGPYVQSLIDSGDYPYFTRVVCEAEHRDPDERFERGIDRMIAGIEATLPR